MEDLKDSLPALRIDIATWRREIQTFVDMTIDELAAINEQLALPFSGSSNRPTGQKSELAERPFAADRETPLPNKLPGVHSSRTDERLNSLKRKLAAKLSGHSQGNPLTG